MAKLPKQAKRVFKGIIFDVYQWPQELYDGSTATFEALKRADTIAVVAVTPEGTIVLTDEEQPLEQRGLGLPVGRVDAGEEPLAAAQRELAEETGYTAPTWELWHSYQPEHKIDWTMWQFVARGAVKTGQQKLDAGEKIEVTERPIAEFLDMISRGELEANRVPPKILSGLLAGKRAEVASFLAAAETPLQT